MECQDVSTEEHLGKTSLDQLLPMLCVADNLLAHIYLTFLSYKGQSDKVSCQQILHICVGAHGTGGCCCSFAVQNAQKYLFIIIFLFFFFFSGQNLEPSFLLFGKFHTQVSAVFRVKLLATISQKDITKATISRNGCIYLLRQIEG